MSRRSYQSPDPLEGVLHLLRGVFPGFSETEAIARRHGLRWEECSTPFVVEDWGVIVAHVGLPSMTSLNNGVERSIGGVTWSPRTTIIGGAATCFACSRRRSLMAGDDTTPSPDYERPSFL